MKVLHVIPSLAQIRGGPSRAILEMVKALRDCGVNAEIACTNDNGLNILDVPLCERIIYEQVPVYFFPRYSPTIVSVREFAFSSQLTAWLWQHIPKYELLHIHAIFSYPSTVAMIIARLKGIPYIEVPHGLLCQWALKQSAYKKQIYLRVIERSNLNNSQALHLTSQKEQQEVCSLSLNVPTFVLPHGVYVAPPIPNAPYLLREYFNLPVDEPVILFLSRLHPVKGLDYLIPALSKLTHHRFSFILAGNGTPEYEAEIKSLLVSTGMHKRTYLAGFVEGEIKNLLLQGSDIFAQTSYLESFGMAVMEALAAGLPVLVTPGVALASFIEQHQIGYIAELNVAAIAKALEQYFSQPQAAKQMGDRARQFVLKNYTWHSIAPKLISVYADILESQSFPAASLHQ
jgi:glycosyltransferase involved in cell wall biosynthesis